jgi:hypothetical protein
MLLEEIGERPQARREIRRAQAVAHGASLALGGEDAGGFKRLQMPRDHREVDAAAAGDLAHGACATAARDAGDEPQPRRLGEGGEEALIEQRPERIAASRGRAWI